MVFELLREVGVARDQQIVDAAVNAMEARVDMQLTAVIRTPARRLSRGMVRYSRQGLDHGGDVGAPERQGEDRRVSCGDREDLVLTESRRAMGAYI